MKYTKEHVGCWIDGATGLDDAHSKLARMIEANFSELTRGGETEGYHPQDVSDCIKSLKDGCREDDLWSADFALRMLQMLTDPGLVWVWEEGDLLLISDSNLD